MFNQLVDLPKGGPIRPQNGLWTSAYHLVHPELGDADPWSKEAIVNAGDTPRVYGQADDTYKELMRNGSPDRTIYEGVEFESNCGSPVGCFAIGCVPCEDVVEQEKPLDCDGGDFLTYKPVAITTRVACSNFGHEGVDYIGRATDNLFVGRDRAIENNLWSGDCCLDENDEPCNPSLEAAENLLGCGKPQPPGVAIGILDMALAECTTSIGMIHMNPVVGARLVAEGYIIPDVVDYGDGMGPRSILRTAARGNIVVIGSGYGETETTEGFPMYATSMVNLVWDKVLTQTGTSENTNMLYTSDNRQEVVAEQIVGAFFDPCCHYGVLTDLCL